jgi:hypothetical protein
MLDDFYNNNYDMIGLDTESAYHEKRCELIQISNGKSIYIIQLDRLNFNLDDIEHNIKFTDIFLDKKVIGFGRDEMASMPIKGDGFLSFDINYINLQSVLYYVEPDKNMVSLSDCCNYYFNKPLTISHWI